MSRVDIAELRRLHEAAMQETSTPQDLRKSMNAAYLALPAILDELEAAQKELRRLTQANADLRKERDRAVAEAQRQDGVAKGLRAQLIRAGGWRPIAEFTDEDEYLTGGRWDQGKWYEYSGKLYWLLAHRCMHARVSPEPPAREVGNG